MIGAGVQSGDDGATRRRLRRPQPAPLVLNIVSMIDVIFLLMTYFLLTAKFTTREESFEVQVPAPLESASAPPEDPFDLPVLPVVLRVSSGVRGGGLSVVTDAPGLAGTGPMTSYDELTARAAASLGTLIPADQRFIIRPEARARWEHALGVLNALKRAGFNNARFANPARTIGGT